MVPCTSVTNVATRQVCWQWSWSTEHITWQSTLQTASEIHVFKKAARQLEVHTENLGRACLSLIALLDLCSIHCSYFQLSANRAIKVCKACTDKRPEPYGTFDQLKAGLTEDNEAYWTTSSRKTHFGTMKRWLIWLRSVSEIGSATEDWNFIFVS